MESNHDLWFVLLHELHACRSARCEPAWYVLQANVSSCSGTRRTSDGTTGMPCGSMPSRQPGVTRLLRVAGRCQVIAFNRRSVSGKGLTPHDSPPSHAVKHCSTLGHALSARVIARDCCRAFLMETGVRKIRRCPAGRTLAGLLLPDAVLHEWQVQSAGGRHRGGQRAGRS